MIAVTEQQIINTLAAQARQISGVKNAYGFAELPDNLSTAQLPALLMYPAGFDSSAKAHHNVHQNILDIMGILFVAPRSSMGGTLKYLENAAMPFMFKFRQHFQTSTTISALLALGLTQATILSGRYGAGGPLLTMNGVEYIGIIFRWQFYEIG